MIFSTRKHRIDRYLLAMLHSEGIGEQCRVEVDRERAPTLSHEILAACLGQSAGIE